jgi:hypothetical protein
MKPEEKLVLGEVEMRELLRKMSIRFTYMTLSLSEDLEYEMQVLMDMVNKDPRCLCSEYFGSTNN